MKQYLRPVLFAFIYLIITPFVNAADATAAGDKLYSKQKFALAAKAYEKALLVTGDTAGVAPKIGAAYNMLDDYRSALIWYARAARQKQASASTKLQYAELLRKTQSYAEAKQQYEEYLMTNPGDNAVKEAVAQLPNIQKLSKDSPAFRVQLANVNSSKGDFAPLFYKDGKIIYFTNVKSKDGVYDKWSLNRKARPMLAAMDSTQSIKSLKLKNGCKAFPGAATFNATNNEVIFSSSSFKKKNLTPQDGINAPVAKLYSTIFDGKKFSKPVELPFNNKSFSNTSPSLSKDGKTLYFASDRPGGFGGSDLYAVTRDANGKWSEPRNLGANVNSSFDENFPFIAENGTLYFASNAPKGLGGLDVYSSVIENGKWANPQNLGSPVNSSKDDYAFIMNSDNKGGYLASNREGGMGSEDIYQFTYDPSKLDYKVTIAVNDAESGKVVENATLILDCGQDQSDNSFSTNTTKTYTIKGNNSCVLKVSKKGYKSTTVKITAADRNKTIEVKLVPDYFELEVVLKETETNAPLRDIAISITNTAEDASVNYGTDEKGVLLTKLLPGLYRIHSPDFPSITGELSSQDAYQSGGKVVKEFFLSRNDMLVNVPLTANCFSSDVTVVNLQKPFDTTIVKANSEGNVRLDLRINSRYAILHHGVADTISTYGLKPGSEVEGACRFVVGQSWVIQNIYYDLNKADIRKDAAKELDKLVFIMKQNPTLEIEFGSHSDCRQTKSFNLALSARRAKSAVNYIVSKGIKQKRVIAAGYGEEKPVNNCVCEGDVKSDCTEDQHQLNRRTEVKVLKY